MQNIACDWEFVSHDRNTIKSMLGILIAVT